MIADVIGWSSHVIDFHLRHNSKGNLNAEYYAIRNKLVRKIRRAFRPRWYFQMTWKPFYVSPSRLQTGFAFAKFKIHNLRLHLRKLAR